MERDLARANASFDSSSSNSNITTSSNLNIQLRIPLTPARLVASQPVLSLCHQSESWLALSRKTTLRPVAPKTQNVPQIIRQGQHRIIATGNPGEEVEEEEEEEEGELRERLLSSSSRPRAHASIASTLREAAAANTSFSR
jgi:hypothetical protein